MSVSMPIRPLKLPAGVTAAMNGQVPDTLLADPGDGKGKLLMVFAQCMRALHLLAAVNGIVLTTTGRGRSLARQRALFLERYEPCTWSQYLAAQASRRGKQWTNEHNDTGHRYWRKRKINGSYPATAATPGTSNHGLNAADDMAEIVDGKVVTLRYSTLQWLYANAPALGIGWELASEPWHVHPLTGDVIPAPVAELLGLNPTPGPGPSPIRPTTSEEDIMLPAIVKTDGGHYAVFGGPGSPAYHIPSQVSVAYTFGRGDGRAMELGTGAVITQAQWPAQKATMTEAALFKVHPSAA